MSKDSFDQNKPTKPEGPQTKIIKLDVNWLIATAVLGISWLLIIGLLTAMVNILKLFL